MKVLLVVAALVAAGCAVTIPDAEVKSQFESFKLKHNKSYASPAEELHRTKIFKENLLRIAKHNERYHKGEVSFTVGVTRFADLLTHEMAEAMNGLRPNASRPSTKVHKAPAVHIPAKGVDWREHGYVTYIKDQGNCGSCWAFSATGALEGQLFKKSGKLVSLSEQNLVDCTNNQKYQNHGCNGGVMDAAFQYVVDNKGIESDDIFPRHYHGEASFCRYNPKLFGGSCTGYVDVHPTEKDLQHAVETVGPVSIGIDGSQWSFFNYMEGIYDEPLCGTSRKDVDHAVLVVGFDYSGMYEKDYWIIKNSWGFYWGEEGYMRMVRNKNACAITTMASYPTV